MNQNLFNILGSFSEYEWKRFGKFISSPYFVNKRNYKKIYSAFRFIYTNKNPRSKLNEDYIRKKIYGKNNLLSRTLHNRLSEFCKLAEKFLVQESFEKNEPEKKHLLLDELFSRQLLKNFGQSNKKLEKFFEEFRYDAVSQATQSKIFQLRSVFYQAKELHKKSYEEFFEHSDSLMAYFLDKLFYIALEFRLLESMDVKFESNIASEIVKSIDNEAFVNAVEKHNEPKYIMAVIRYYLYKAYLNQENEFYIGKVKFLLSKHKNNFGKPFKSALYLKLEAYYVNLINKGKTEYERELFMLYKEKLGQGITDDLSKIYYPAQNFRDYVVVGLRVGEIEWVENFIKKYSHLLPESIRDDELTIATARVLIEKKEFAKALKILKAHKSDKQIHTIDMSRLKLKVYYELKMYEEIFLEMDNLKHFIRKENTHKFYKSMTENYLKNLNSLMKLTTGSVNKNKSGLNEYISKLEKTDNMFPDKNWFLIKAKDISR